jgi:hypothetical protein
MLLEVESSQLVLVDYQLKLMPRHEGRTSSMAAR